MVGKCLRQSCQYDFRWIMSEGGVAKERAGWGPQIAGVSWERTGEDEGEGRDKEGEDYLLGTDVGAPCRSLSPGTVRCC